MADKVAKNRQKRFPSDTGPRCKLTMKQAREARQLRKEGHSIRDLAKQFGLSLPSMKTLLSGKSYKEENG
jgi:DNA-binding MarR family transcriptional regulator